MLLPLTSCHVEAEAGMAVLHRPRPSFPSFWEQLFTDLRNQLFPDSPPNPPNKREPPSPYNDSAKMVSIRSGVASLSVAIRRRLGVSGYTEIAEDGGDTRD